MVSEFYWRLQREDAKLLPDDWWNSFKNALFLLSALSLFAQEVKVTCEAIAAGASRKGNVKTILRLVIAQEDITTNCGKQTPIQSPYWTGVCLCINKTAFWPTILQSRGGRGLDHFTSGSRTPDVRTETSGLRSPDAIFCQIHPDSGFRKLRVPDFKKKFFIENQNNQTMEMGSQILFQFQSLSLSAPQLNMLVCLLIFHTFSAHVPRPRHCHSFGGRAAESSFKKTRSPELKFYRVRIPDSGFRAQFFLHLNPHLRTQNLLPEVRKSALKVWRGPTLLQSQSHDETHSSRTCY